MSKYEIDNIKLTAPKFDRKDLEYAMTYRYACKKFDSTKKISDEDWQGILTAARLSPTSLGFEAYQLLVIQNPEIIAKFLNTVPITQDNIIHLLNSNFI